MGSGALGDIGDSMIVFSKVLKKDYQRTIPWQGLRSRKMKPLALSFHCESMTLTVPGELGACVLSEAQENIMTELECET